jgi:hypothetical protein
VREGASHLRERLPDRGQIAASTYEDTALWAFGALALGAVFGAALPVSQRERELLEPARRKVREATQQATEMALEKGGEAMDEVSSRLEPERHEEPQRHEEPERTTGYTGGAGFAPSPYQGSSTGMRGSADGPGSDYGASSSDEDEDSPTPLVGPGGPSTPIH